MLSQKRIDEMNKDLLLLNQCFYWESENRYCVVESINIYDTDIAFNVASNGRRKIMSQEDIANSWKDFKFYIKTDGIAKPENYVRRLKTYFGSEFDEESVVYTSNAEWRKIYWEKN